MAYIDAGARLKLSLIAEEIRKKVEPIFRNHVLMGALRGHGRITYNHSSDEVKWHPRVLRRPLVPGIGNVTETTFGQTNTRIEMTLPWRMYEMGESTTKFERLASKDRATSLYQAIQRVVEEMSEDFVEGFNDELFVDGNASGSKRIHGLESIYGIDNNTDLVNLNSSGNGVVGEPSDSYAGKDTDLAALGGDWTPDDDKEWPTGTGKTEYCALSPIIVDYNNTNLGGDTANFASQWQHALNYLLTYGETLQKQTYDLILLNPDLMRQAKDSLIGQERFVASAKTKLTDLGFKTLSYENTEITMSYGVPSGVGYALRFEKMSLRSMQSQLVMPESDFDIVTSQKLHKLDCYCQMVFETPAFFGKLQGLSTAGT